MNTNTFRNMSYGVYVVTTFDHDRPVGCIANSIMQISSEPPTVAVSINHDNYTNHCITKSGQFAFSILSEKSAPNIIGTFGFHSSRDTNKFSDIPYITKKNLPVIIDTCGYVLCHVRDIMETETHTVFLGEVTDANTLDTSTPAMTYAYYHNVIKGKTPKNAPSYLQEKNSESPEKRLGRWECQVCAYVYEGESLKKDFRCPICGQNTDKFLRIE